MDKMFKTFGFGGTIIFTILLTIALVAVAIFIIAPLTLWYAGTGVGVMVRKGNLRPIITALENYKRDRRYYPDSIEFLEVSGYIEALPETRFRYNLLDADKYTLCFGTHLRGIDFPNEADCDLECYSSVSKQWEPGKDKDDSGCY